VQQQQQQQVLVMLQHMQLLQLQPSDHCRLDGSALSSGSRLLMVSCTH
jgi:hypothetical protein